jgi:hypothetical protein
MAFLYDVNNASVATSAEVVFALKTLLKLAGWDVPNSGDSLTYFPASDGITGAGAGAGGLNNSTAWFRIRGPATMSPRREFVFQRGTTERAWWIRVSAEDTFVGGAPSATVAPTATDQENLHGTVAAGTALFAVAATYKFHMAADDAAPFTWYCESAINGTGAVDAILLFDAMVAGSFNALDQDPAIYYITNGAASLDITALGGAAGPKGWYQKDLAGDIFVPMPLLYYNSNSFGTGVPENIGTNPYDSDDNHFPIPCGRPSGAATQVGWKGFLSMTRWCGVNRANMDTLSDGGTRTKVIMGMIVLPWDGSVPSV